MLNSTEKIEHGKQQGYEICTVINEKKYWISAAIQKYKGKYKAYVSKIAESKMAAEIYDFDIIKTFPNLNDAYTFVRQKTKIEKNDLKSLKGQRLFNANHSDYNETSTPVFGY